MGRFSWKSVCRTTGTKEGRQIRQRESDGRIVPMKAGNSAGGKAATSVTVLQGDMYCAQTRRRRVHDIAAHSVEGSQ